MYVELFCGLVQVGCIIWWCCFTPSPPQNTFNTTKRNYLLWLVLNLRSRRLSSNAHSANPLFELRNFWTALQSYFFKLVSTGLLISQISCSIYNYIRFQFEGKILLWLGRNLISSFTNVDITQKMTIMVLIIIFCIFKEKILWHGFRGIM